MSEIQITKLNFKEEVLESKQPVLLDFWATWCGPCQMLSPVVKEIAQTHPEIKVGKINVDEEAELAGAFHISSIPMLILMKNGTVEKQMVGYRPKQDVENMLR